MILANHFPAILLALSPAFNEDRLCKRKRLLPLIQYSDHAYDRGDSGCPEARIMPQRANLCGSRSQGFL